jgi:hypothetical protein
MPARNLDGGRRLNAVLPMLISLFDQLRLFAEGTFPWVVTEPGIDLVLQKSFAEQAPHGSSAAGATEFIDSLNRVLWMSDGQASTSCTT